MKRLIRSAAAFMLAVILVLSAFYLSPVPVEANDSRINVTGFKEFDVSEVNSARLIIALESNIYKGGWIPKYWFGNSDENVPFEEIPFSNQADFDGSRYSIPLRNGGSSALSAGDWKLYVWCEKYSNQLNIVGPNVYSLHIRGYEASNNAELKNLEIPGVSLMYDNDTNNYWASVPYDVTNIEIQAEAVDERAVIEGTGHYSLSAGQNEFSVRIISEDGTAASTHTIVLYRENRALSSDVSLENLSVSGAVLSYDNEESSYWANISYDTEQIEIIANATDANATVTGTGYYNLAIGINQFSVTVTAEDGITTQTYNITLYRDKLLSDDTSLKVLKVSDADLSYNSETDNYFADVPNNISSVYITAEAAHETSEVYGAGYHSLNEGRNEFIITVTAENGSSKEYFIIINRETYKDSNNTQLKELRIGGIDLSYDMQQDYYWALVPYETDEVTIIAEAMESSATVDGAGWQRLEVGSNMFMITVTAEDRVTSQTYTVMLQRENIVLSSNANLSTLEIRGIPLAYDSNKDLYWADVANEIDAVEILAVAEHENASVDGGGYHNLTLGSNQFKVTVTAEDGYTTRVYSLRLRRETSLSSNANLASLSLNGAELTYDSAKDEYWAVVPYEVSGIEIIAEAEHEKAMVVGAGYENIEVGFNRLTVKVTAENGTAVRTYRIVLYREAELSSNTNLRSLTVSGAALAYSNMENEYWATVPYEYENIEILAEAEHEKATVAGTGFFKLNLGSNRFDVTVTAQNGTSQTYKLNINRKGGLSDNANLKSLSVSYIPLAYDNAMRKYWANVSNDIEEVEIIAVAEHEMARVDGAGYKRLAEGPNHITITVTAEDGVTAQAYEIILNRAGKLSDDAMLKSLIIPGISLKYDTATGEHWAGVPYEISRIEIIAEANNEKAIVRGAGLFNLSVGRNEIPITVTAENGITVQVYTIVIKREDISRLSNNTNLKSLDIKYLSLFYNSGANEYWANVANGISTIEIIAETEHPNATLIGDGFHNLDVGSNPFLITVTAEDGVTAYSYKLVVNRAYPSSSGSSDGTPSIDKTPTVPAATPPSVSEELDVVPIASEPLAPEADISISTPLAQEGSTFQSTPVAPSYPNQATINDQSPLAQVASAETRTPPMSTNIENQFPTLAPYGQPEQQPVPHENGQAAGSNAGTIYFPATELGNVAEAHYNIKAFWSQPATPDGNIAPEIVETIDLSPSAYRGKINDVIGETGVVIGNISVISEKNNKYRRISAEIDEAGSYRVHLLVNSNVGEPLYNSRVDGILEYTIN